MLLYWPDCPVYGPIAFINFIVLKSCFDISETIVFQSKTDDLDIILVEVKVITPVRRGVRSD
jgi:hypothetical protein